MEKKEDKKNTIFCPFPGAYEGISRCLSQMCTYPFETRKTQRQVLGKTHGSSICFRGIFQSSFTTGFVFMSYFSVYHALDGNVFASSVAALTTSFVKIPIGNCMRIIQLHNHKQNLLQCGKQVLRTKGIRGLYSGYALSIAEDIIETSIRNGMFEVFRKKVPNYEWNLGMLIGALAGSFAAGITTPFDTIRANMACSTALPIKESLFMDTTRRICKRGNPMVELYSGGQTRTFSNGIRYALFYLFLSSLEKQNGVVYSCNNQ